MRQWLHDNKTTRVISMKHYGIIYDTEFGAADFGGEYSHYQTFIAAANKEARAMGLIEDGESVLDCDNEITVDGEVI